MDQPSAILGTCLFILKVLSSSESLQANTLDTKVALEVGLLKSVRISAYHHRGLAAESPSSSRRFGVGGDDFALARDALIQFVSIFLNLCMDSEGDVERESFRLRFRKGPAVASRGSGA